MRLFQSRLRDVGADARMVSSDAPNSCPCIGATDEASQCQMFEGVEQFVAVACASNACCTNEAIAITIRGSGPRRIRGWVIAWGGVVARLELIEGRGKNLALVHDRRDGRVACVCA